MTKIKITKHKKSLLKIARAAVPVKAGFPSPAEDFYQKPLSLDELLVAHPASTYFVQASGQSMEGEGIANGDILVVDKSLEPTHNSIVIAQIDGELTVKKLYKLRGQIKLCAANPSYKDIVLNGEQELNIWGEVTAIIKQVKNLQ